MNTVSPKKEISAFRLYGITALVSLLMAAFALAGAQVWPFGSGFLTWMDNGQLAVPDFGYIRQIAEGRSDLFWSYANGGCPRSSVHPTFNNLCSPLTWLVAFLPGIGGLAKLSCLFLLQAAILPLGALFYIRRNFPRVPATISALLALSYAFSEFLFTKYTSLSFTNIAILFPFYLYGLDMLLKRGKWVLYTLLLALMLSVGTYYAYMWLLFTIVYAASRTGWRWHSPMQQHNTMLLWATMLALALAAAWWCPSYMVTGNSARAGAPAWKDLVSLSIVKELISLWLIPFTGLAFLLLSPCKKSILCKRYGLSLTVLMIGLIHGSAHFVWHSSVPYHFPGRFSYMAAMMAVCIGAQSWYSMRHRPRKNLFYGLLLALPLLFIHLNDQPGTTRNAMDILWFTGLGISVWAFGQKWQRWGIAGAILIMALGLLGHVTYHVKKCAPESVMGDAGRVEAGEWAEQLLPPRDGQFYGRVKTISQALIDNVALHTKFESLGLFTGCERGDSKITMNKWGHMYSIAMMSDEGGTIFSDTLFGTRYYIIYGDTYTTHGTPLASKGNYHLYENPWYFGLGLMLPSLVDLEMPKGQPAHNQVKAMNLILGEKANFQINTWQLGDKVATNSWTYLVQPIAERGRTYTYANTPYTRWDACSFSPNPVAPPLQLLPAQQRLNIQALRATASRQLETLTIDESTLQSLKDYASALPVCVSYRGKQMTIDCESTSERDMLFLPMLWQDGYHATDETGNPLNLKNNGGFVSILMPSEGKHSIILEWRAPGSTFGWTFSTLGLICMVLLASRQRSHASSHTQGWFNALCRQGLLLGCLTLFLLPVLCYPLGFLQMIGKL